METALSAAQSVFREGILTAKAKVILEYLDAPRKKSELPIRPLIYEFGASLPKAGKDTLRGYAERWWHKRNFNVSIPQESAEADLIRSTPRDDAYAFEMTHFSYNFMNMQRAVSNRSFHIIFPNRGIFDNLWFLEWKRRTESITEAQYGAFREFVLSGPCGPWEKILDGIFAVNCTVEESLRREYGSAKSVKYGSRMNPKTLGQMAECTAAVLDLLAREIPNLAVFYVDTTGRSVEDAGNEIIARMAEAAERRFKISETSVIPRSREMLREYAILQPPFTKVAGTISHAELRRHGWSFLYAAHEVDEYLAPKGLPPLTNDECFHIRETGGRRYFIFKWGTDTVARTKITVDLPGGSIENILKDFDHVVTIVKRREVFGKDGFRIGIDAVEELGNFIEITAPSVGDGDVLAQIAAELGFSSDKIVPESYLRLWLKRQTRK